MKTIFLVLLFSVIFQTAQAKEMKEWTFLTFMNGHDQMLSDVTDMNLALMEKVGSTDDINIVAQVASLSRTETERVYVEKGNTVVIEKLPRVDMGDYRELNKFIEWVVTNYPAKKYFINVWNHGAGWHNFRFRTSFDGGGDFHTQDVSFDGLTGNFITTEQMGNVMKQFASLIGHKVDLYGNDACLMAMIEVAAEFKDSVAYFTSSQENEPAAGWPYDKILTRWAQNPTSDGKDVGIIVTEEYLKRYPDEFSNPAGSTYSVIDVSELDGLMDALKNLRNDLQGLGSAKSLELKNLATSTHNFDGGSDYKDLYDFVLNLEKSSLGVNKSTLSDVKSAFKKVVIKSVNSYDEEGAYGLSVWLPTYDMFYIKHAARYEGLEFNKQTGWADLLASFFQQ